MAVKRPVVVDPGSVLAKAVHGKKSRKQPGKQIAPSHPVTVPEISLSPAEIGTSPEHSAAFDPSAFLLKLSTGKSKQEYQDNEAVFSQGDAADAVFYIQSGKVKLTVVSKRGKEAVVAILPEGSFFGEGSLAGRPLRISTASTVERSTIIRVEKRVMVGLLHKEPEFAERFLAYVLSRMLAII
jgi:CRP-like cAMP-binding protein